MPHIDNEVVGYIDGEFIFLNSEGERTTFATEFVPDWKVDEDPRLVASYVGTAEDRDAYTGYGTGRESHYVNDVLTSKSGIVPEDKQYAAVYGYDVVPAAGRIVRCWYCDPRTGDGEFSYREFQKNRYDACEEEFVTQMLIHYSEHRAAGDLPYVTTYFPGKEVRRPNGEVAAVKPGVVRTWQIKGALLGSYHSPK